MYFGSRAPARPASKTPNRVSAEAAISAAPDSAAAARPLPASPVLTSPVPASPAAVSTSLALIIAPARPFWYGSAAAGPRRRSSSLLTVSSAAAPSMANLAACTAWLGRTASMPRPPAAAVADPANRNGISR